MEICQANEKGSPHPSLVMLCCVQQRQPLNEIILNAPERVNDENEERGTSTPSGNINLYMNSIVQPKCPYTVWGKELLIK